MIMTFKEAKELLREKLGKDATFSLHIELHSTPITDSQVMYTASHLNRHWQGMTLKEAVDKCLAGGPERQSPDTAVSQVE